MPDFQLVGAEEIERLLRQMPEAVAQHVVEGALRGGAKIVAEDMKARAPVLDHPVKHRVPGKLRDSIMLSKAKRATRLLSSLVIGFKYPGNKYAHLVEFGTGERMKKDGASSGAMPAHPFIRPAIDEKGQATIAEIGRLAGQGVAREAKKLSKRIRVWSK